MVMLKRCTHVMILIMLLHLRLVCKAHALAAARPRCIRAARPVSTASCHGNSASHDFCNKRTHGLLSLGWGQTPRTLPLHAYERGPFERIFTTWSSSSWQLRSKSTLSCGSKLRAKNQTKPNQTLSNCERMLHAYTHGPPLNIYKVGSLRSLRSRLRC